MRKFLASIVGVIFGAAILIQAMTSPVGASVSNPGAVTFVIDKLSISIGSTTAAYDSNSAPGCSDGVEDANDADTLTDFPADPECASASDDSETKSGAQPHVVAKLVGTVSGAGAISVPVSGATMPAFYLENSSAGGDGVVTVTPRVVQPVTGTADPSTGALAMRLRMVVDLDAANLPAACAIGTSTAPIDMASLSTASSGGVAYSTATGAATITDHNYAIPGSSGCSFFANAINSAIGVPSAAGNNHAVFNVHTTPILTAGAAPTSSTGGRDVLHKRSDLVNERRHHVNEPSDHHDAADDNDATANDYNDLPSLHHHDHTGVVVLVVRLTRRD